MSQVSPNLTLHRCVSGSGEATALDVSVQDLVCQANVLLLFPPVNCEQMREQDRDWLWIHLKQFYTLRV